MKVPSGRTRLLLACAATLALLVPVAWSWWSSLLPETYDAASMGYVDTGGGPAPAGGAHTHDHGAGSVAAHHSAAIAVADLVADPDPPADVRFMLTVEQDGKRILVNGSTPGPALRVVEGQLVEVTLVNRDVRAGTTLHWHGVDVPNAMDGVAGVTQDAVGPGARFVYRFVADRPGTYWYHAHQLSHVQVREGLLGALVVEPKAGLDSDSDLVAVLHQYDGVATVNGSPGVTRLDASPDEEVRLRLVNTDNVLASAWVTGAPFRLLAVDGTDLHQPGEVGDRWVGVTAGARIDLGFVVPPGGVRVDVSGTTTILVGGPTDAGASRGVPPQPKRQLDLLSYGSPTDPGLDASDPDRRFDYDIGRRLGFLDGKPGRWWTINGHLFPDVPMFVVAEGDVVVVRIANHSGEDHPMHLHGHHALVLSRDGKPSTGSPWWVDSLEVAAGEEYEIGFLADNPGIWMDHCHNLPHATEGLIAHLMYDGVESSYLLGGGNAPE